MLGFLYHSALGRLILKLLTRPFISKAAGAFMDSRISVPFIRPFIKKNNIDLSDYEIEKWRSFNEFFTRKVKSGARVFVSDPNALPSPCDGLLSVYSISEELRFSVKNSVYSVSSLLENSEIAKDYLGGSCLVFRLTPTHYHRYAYPDSGLKGENIHINGILHTVQPIAVESVPVYTRNSREYTVLKTDNFGNIVFVEVGAMMVGRIVNLHSSHTFSRGEEKGRFEFGGSTIIMLIKPDTVQILPEIKAASANGIEFPIKAGEVIGTRCPKASR